MRDPYLYDDVDVLQNRAGIRDYELLRKAEADVTNLAMAGLYRRRYEVFDTDTLRDIHRTIFGQIYEWAGEFRTIPMIKPEDVLGGDTVRYAQSMQSGYNAPEAVGFSRRTASSSLKYASIPASSSLPDRKIRPLRVEDFARGGRSCPARRAGAGILPYGKNAQQSGCGRHSAQNALYPDCIDYPKEIKKQLNNAMKALAGLKRTGENDRDVVFRMVRLLAQIWQTHPFREGNTRSVIVFAVLFAQSLGFSVRHELFYVHAAYVRNALVWASQGIYSKYEYLERIFFDAVLGEDAARETPEPDAGRKYETIGDYKVADYKERPHEYKDTPHG